MAEVNLKCMQGNCSIQKEDMLDFFAELAPGWEKDLVVDTEKINTILNIAGIRPGGRLTVAHSMGLEQLNRHHAGRVAKVSVGPLPACEPADIFRRWFDVDTKISV